MEAQCGVSAQSRNAASAHDAPTQTWPALVAAVTDLAGKITGAHRTWLDPTGHGKAPVDTPRRAMGYLLGNAVRFGQRGRIALDRLRDPGRRHQAADDAFAIVGLKPVDAHRVVRQPFPDWQQQAGDNVQVAVAELRHRGYLGLPGVGEVRPIRLPPMRLRHVGDGDCGALHRAEQADPPFDLTVVEHQARRRHLHGGAPGLAVDQKLGTGIFGPLDRLGKGKRLVAVAAGDGEHLRLGPRLRMDVKRPATGQHGDLIDLIALSCGFDRIGDDQSLGRHRLNTEVIGARCDGTLDPGAQQILEHAEQGVLQVDGQCEQPIEEGGDRR
jgi:hypothetical protein